ncbi:MAG: hypothetical protein KGJ86_09580 [Chloroflexota bacterium]|nr:hypothetical protein [Chloroflexota bacterium]
MAIAPGAGRPLTLCFLDETGGLHLATDHLFGIGVLIVRDLSRLTNALTKASLNLHGRWMAQRHQLRREAEQHLRNSDHLALGQLLADGNSLSKALSRSRHRECKFNAIGPDNVEEVLSFLRVFFARAGESEFHAMIVERDERAMRCYGGRYWPLYVRSAKRLLAHRIKEPTFAVFDWQGQPEHDDLCLEDEIAKVPHILGSLRIASDTSPFIQVADLLLGAASFDWRDAHGRLGRSRAADLKRDVVRVIKRQLHLPMDSPFLAEGRTYFSRQKPFRFTLWQSGPDFLKEAARTPKARGMRRGLTRGTGGPDRAPAELSASASVA